MSLGLALPLLVAGPTALAVAAAVAVLGLLAVSPRAGLVGQVGDAAASPLGVAACLTLALWLASAAGSFDPARSLEVWLRTAVLLPVGVALTAILRRNPRAWRLALKALVAGGLACVAAGLIALWLERGLAAWLLAPGEERHLPFLPVTVKKPYGTVLALAMPVVLWAGLRLPRGWRPPAFAFQALALAVMYTLGARAGLVAAALGAGVFACWLVLRHGRAWWLLVLVPVVLGALAVVAFVLAKDDLQTPGLGLPVWLIESERQEILAFSMAHVPNAPWFGAGMNVIDLLPVPERAPALGHRQPYVPSHPHIVIAGLPYVPSHPHNVIVEVLVETGAVGLTAFALALLVLAGGLLAAMRADGMAGAALLAVNAAFWTAGMVSYSFWEYWWQASWILIMVLPAAALPPGTMTAGRWWRGRSRTPGR